MKSLSKQQIRNIIEGRGAAERIPLIYHFWVSPNTFGENAEKAQEYLDHYPFDIERVGLRMPDILKAPDDDANYRYIHENINIDENSAIDSRMAISDWDQLDEILENFPSPEYPNLIPQIEKSEKYRLVHWWFWMFERFWSLRGMENALIDFYTNPDEVHKLFTKLTSFYCRVLERAKEELDADGLFLSDDIGTQTSGFFSIEIFNEFFKPYYKILTDKAHSLGMHLWFHCCGNIEMYLPGLIEIGIDVLHPIQKYAMDEKHIAKEFGGQICIWAGFDVQRIIPYGSTQDVRAEVKNIIDTFYRTDGRFMLTFGNAVTRDCPIESLYAVLDESYSYGIEKCRN